MAGRGEPWDAAIDGPNDPRIQQWTRDNKITTAMEYLQHADYSAMSSTQMVGLGTAFGRAYVRNLPVQRNVLLVPTAKGSTSLVDGPWSAGEELWEAAVERLEAALESNSGSCVAAVLWHQGERDTQLDVVDQERYGVVWTEMISALRARVPASAEAPTILGEFAPEVMELMPDTFPRILAAIRAIPDTVSRTAMAPSDGLASNAEDAVHFSAAAMREYGRTVL
eukprot:g20974.t1